MIKTIAFDADDTLWHNEVFYKRTKKHLADILSSHQSPEQTEVLLDRIEIENLRFYGYGIKSFALSMVETAIQTAGAQISDLEIAEILRTVKEILSSEVELLPDVEHTLSQLAGSYRLMLITKGDLFEQDRKVHNSGLAGYFHAVEIVSNKSNTTYRNLLEKYLIQPEHFLMVGNSLRSDILPPIAIGAKAVYIPYQDTWDHENNVDEPIATNSFYEIESISELPVLIAQIDQA